jgi:hypothetical protein
VAFDAEHRLVLSVVPGKRTAANLYRLVADAQQRTEFRPLRLLVSDEYRAYLQVILERYGVEVFPEHAGPGRPPSPTLEPDEDLVYATVHKTRHRGRVVRVEPQRVFGSPRQLRKALLASSVSRTVNLAFVERHNATDRHRNARKGRRTYRFSKDWDVHNAMTYFTMYSYNFCWPVRTLRKKDADGHWQPRTPAMAAGLDDHVWSLREWATFPAFQLE